MSKFTECLEILTQSALVLVALVVSLVLIKNYLLTPASGGGKQQQAVSGQPDSNPVGSTLSVTGVDWTRSRQTLVLALQKGCRYCSESAPFYQRLVRDYADAEKTRLVAVLPNDVETGRGYLESLDVPIQEVRQAALSSIKVKGTPTLLLVNQSGEVVAYWRGKLTQAGEADVLRRMGQVGGPG